MRKSILAFSAALLLCSCVSEDKEVYSRQMKIESVPADALVVMDGFKLGRTPLEVGVETTESGCFVKKTVLTIIPADEKNYTQAETFPAFRKSSPEESRVPEKVIFDLTKNPQTQKTTTIEY